MACPRCEAHVNEAVKNAFPVKKVESFRDEKKTIVLSAKAIDEEALRSAVEKAGYKVLGVETSVEKPSLLSWLKR